MSPSISSIVFSRRGLFLARLFRFFDLDDWVRYLVELFKFCTFGALFLNIIVELRARIYYALHARKSTGPCQYTFLTPSLA